jgi:hypothetical protein
VLSHAPRRSQAMMMLIDAFQPEGITRLAVDSIFMMPHLGVLAQVHEAAAAEVFERDCLIYLGTCISPLNAVKAGRTCMEYQLTTQGATRRGSVPAGEVVLEQMPAGETAELVVEPARSVDVGAGRGKTLQTRVHGGVVGVAFDGRGRPLEVPVAGGGEMVARWSKAFDAYPS